MGVALDPEHRYIDNGWLSESLLRPGLEALRDAVALGNLDCVVMYDPDRLSRRFVDQQVVLEEIARRQVEVVFIVGGVAHTDEDRMALQMRGVFAEYERAKIRERTRRGRLHRARTGAPPGWSNPPYGYRYLSGKKPHPGTVVVEACEAAVVRQIFEWVAVDGLRLWQVASRLEQRGIKPRAAKHWATSTLGGIVRNRVYAGHAHHQKYESVEPREPRDRRRFRRRRKTSARLRPEHEWIGVRVPAIIDETLFDKAQQSLVDNRRRTAGQAKHQHLLRSLLFCAACGRKMWAFGGRFGTRYEYLRLSIIWPSVIGAETPDVLEVLRAAGGPDGEATELHEGGARGRGGGRARAWSHRSGEEARGPADQRDPLGSGRRRWTRGEALADRDA
jgi:site-specific DNA recombinase